MDELNAVRQLLAEPPPTPDVITAARTRLEHATLDTRTTRRRIAGHTWRPAPRRVWRPVTAAGVAAAVVAVAAGVVTAQALAPGGANPDGALTVHRLARLTAAEAASQPAIPPGQWVYWKRKNVTQNAENRTVQLWTTADGAKAAHLVRGRVRIIDLRGFYKPPVTYADLGSLPRRPQALLRYLAGHPAEPLRQGNRPASEFYTIEVFLTSYVMPPQLTAEFYRAAADIPGVTVDPHAVDLAGRHGVGFRLRQGDEIIVWPRSYRLMGTKYRLTLANSPVTHGFGGVAILREAPVSGPGVLP